MSGRKLDTPKKELTIFRNENLRFADTNHGWFGLRPKTQRHITSQARQRSHGRCGSGHGQWRRDLSRGHSRNGEDGIIGGRICKADLILVHERYRTRGMR